MPPDRSRRCPACDAPWRDPRARYCGHCGGPLRPNPVPAGRLGARRRLVVALMLLLAALGVLVIVVVVLPGAPRGAPSAPAGDGDAVELSATAPGHDGVEPRAGSSLLECVGCRGWRLAVAETTRGADGPG